MYRKEQMSLKQIASWLHDQGIKTATGKELWHESTIYYIIQAVERRRAETESEAAPGPALTPA